MPRQDKNSSAYPGMDFKPLGRFGIQEMFYLPYRICADFRVRFEANQSKSVAIILQSNFLLFPKHDLV